uniref:Transposon Ty3-I Gag-Pol polyprotein n=1 Tax=Cajanus cajan TaxID=3821 RepID=A0A151QPW9_CAJCA|nr:hypothetical protein KK1_046993 [Cajanus cajan]
MKAPLKPLLLTLMIEGHELNKVFVDEGETINILPRTMLKRSGKTLVDLKPHNILISDYAGKSSHPEGIILLDVQIGSVKRTTMFIVTPSKANVNVLLGQEWIHGVGVVPSTIHQKIFFWNDGEGLEALDADQKEYEVGMYFVDQQLTAFAKTKPSNAHNANMLEDQEGFKKILCWDVHRGFVIRIEGMDVTLTVVKECVDKAVRIAKEKEDKKTKNDQENQEVENKKKEASVPETKLDCVFNDSPLGFENSRSEEYKLESQLFEFYTNNEYKDCSAWYYEEMRNLDRGLVEHRLLTILGKKPMKQSPRRFALKVIYKIKEEIERLLKAKFIRTLRYAEWISNIVPVIKKNGKLRVCIDFRDLNLATPSVKAQVIADFLVDHSNLIKQENFVTMKPWELFFNGSKHKLGTG